MTVGIRCAEVRELAPELALGIADGKERADALDHLGSCTRCRAHLAALTDVADDLLALTPAEEPPLGFETRVLAGLGIGPELRPRPRARSRVLVAAVAAACLLLGVGAATVSLRATWSDERQLAGQYRAALDSVGGEYFQAAPLRNTRGTRVGQIFGYQGQPSWLFIVVYGPYRQVALTGSLTTTDRNVIPLGQLELDAERSSWGGEIPIDLREVELVRLVDDTGGVYEAKIPPDPDG
jgi:hypothetical protein